MDSTFFKSMTDVERAVDRAFGAVAMATVRMNSFGWLDGLIGGSDFIAAKDDLLLRQKKLWGLVESSKEHLAALQEIEQGLKEVCSGREALHAMAALGMNIKNLPG